MFWLLTTLTVMATVSLPPVYRLLRPIIPQVTLQSHNVRSAANIVYTRTGDNGSSGLFSGERRPKDDAVFEALGTTDELTSSIGLAREFVRSRLIRDELEAVQCILQDLQATVATPKSSAREAQLARTKWNVDHLVDLEAWIDVHSASGRASASLHLARAICRRAERRLVPLLDDGLELPVLQYLNRLSSYLFTVARVCAREDGFEETVYRRPRQQQQQQEEGENVDQ
ncbi:hypothetical protein TYRP_017157 [Tyrophagus putrescentiae]|nr:hypothetical protein TYRP_017157 [Tyrophagus putrescentiae]